MALGLPRAEMSWKYRDNWVSLSSAALAKYVTVARTNTKNKLVTLFGAIFVAMGGVWPIRKRRCMLSSRLGPGITRMTLSL